MSSYWPGEDGWPYPDTNDEWPDLDVELDDDILSLKAPHPHLFDALDPMEREVITARYGLDGQPARSMKQLHSDLGLSRSQLRDVLGSGLGKLREQFRDP
jgi:DNA-directed RNA polymerase sigma subunit (sigma70/sigma32)